ncbi:MAG: hypothetical protein JO126_02660 [Alphaproteobacteria bacterium]|nr:hypothetical protein [Alphaproteobacteria bacterium]MBV8548342.1 hypothetical protein [Alphaproteobacteria bacterium]
MNKKQQPEPNYYTPEREERVAAALRENLRKRKAQQNAQQQIDTQKQ